MQRHLGSARSITEKVSVDQERLLCFLLMFPIPLLYTINWRFPYQSNFTSQSSAPTTNTRHGLFRWWLHSCLEIPHIIETR
jgi:hypothetical protein